MGLPAIFDVVFAAGVVVAAAALAGAAFRLAERRLLVAATVIDGAMAVGAWVALALHHDRELLVAAGGLTIATLAAAASLPLSRALQRGARIDAELERARKQLADLVSTEADARQVELERVLAR